MRITIQKTTKERDLYVVTALIVDTGKIEEFVGHTRARCIELIDRCRDDDKRIN